jgi:competence protein ComEA
VPNHRSPLDTLRRFELGAAAVRALAVLAVLVALGAVLVAWRSRPTVAPVAPGPASLSSPESVTVIVVAVMGRVQRPGLVELPAGSRVADALAAAGGPLPETDLSTLNLARKLVDGELITVGVSPPSGAASGPLNLNTATAAQLEELPGVGPVLAQRIVEYRDQHGGFRTVDELRDVPGIGDAIFRQLESRVTV